LKDLDQQSASCAVWSAASLEGPHLRRGAPGREREESSQRIPQSALVRQHP